MKPSHFIIRCLPSVTFNIIRNNSTKPRLSKVFHFINKMPEESLVSPSSRIEEGTNKMKPKKSQSKSKSFKLMQHNGLIHHASSGTYHLLPLAMRSLGKLISIIDKLMAEISAQKIEMPILTPKNICQKTGRWEMMGSEMFRISDRHESDYCLAPTCEEAVTKIMADVSISQMQLPILLYQISKKFRDEKRPKSGLLRSREFIMKDLYSFDESAEMAEKTYALLCETYSKLFEYLGLTYIKALAPTGVIGGHLSHEFHLPVPVGEDTVAVCPKCHYASNIELAGSLCSNCKRECDVHQCIEVGHTFLLGDKYSEAFQAKFTKEDKPCILQMGCFGLGVTRILAAAIEQLSLDNQIRWPLAIAPYTVCIITPKKGSKEEKANGRSLAEHIHNEQENIPNYTGDFILDDRDYLTIGSRLWDAKKLGFPYVVVVGKQVINSIPKVELININEDTTQYLTILELFQWFHKFLPLQNDFRKDSILLNSQHDNYDKEKNFINM